MVWTFKQFDNLPQQQIELWASLLEKRTGIQLTRSRQVMLQNQVVGRMRELSINSHSEYYGLVCGNNGLAEWQVLVDRLVIKETSFFRDRPSLELVRQHLKSQIKELTPEKINASSSLELWSIGCSTGEESYALAAIANDCFQDRNLLPYYGVTAFDISLPALSIARRGEYGSRCLSLLSQSERDSYFTPCGEKKFCIKDSIRKRVCFSQYNILDLKYKPLQLMDVIYCQNVLIYFRRWRRKEILNTIVEHLKPNGILVLGVGEVTDWNHKKMQRIANNGVQAYVKYN